MARLIWPFLLGYDKDYGIRLLGEAEGGAVAQAAAGGKLLRLGYGQDAARGAHAAILYDDGAIVQGAGLVKDGGEESLERMASSSSPVSL